MADKVLKELRGAGKIFDFRGTGLLPANGGVIQPLIMVEHIPVVPNVKGTGDFHTLARVLRAQGLSLQAATDREGNVALYNNLNRLCFQARGGKSGQLRRRAHAHDHRRGLVEEAASRVGVAVAVRRA